MRHRPPHTTNTTQHLTNTIRMPIQPHRHHTRHKQQISQRPLHTLQPTSKAYRQHRPRHHQRTPQATQTTRHPNTNQPITNTPHQYHLYTTPNPHRQQRQHTQSHTQQQQSLIHRRTILIPIPLNKQMRLQTNITTTLHINTNTQKSLPPRQSHTNQQPATLTSHTQHSQRTTKLTHNRTQQQHTTQLQHQHSRHTQTLSTTFTTLTQQRTITTQIKPQHTNSNQSPKQPHRQNLPPTQLHPQPHSNQPLHIHQTFSTTQIRYLRQRPNRQKQQNANLQNPHRQLRNKPSNNLPTLLKTHTKAIHNQNTNQDALTNTNYQQPNTTQLSLHTTQHNPYQHTTRNHEPQNLASVPKNQNSRGFNLSNTSSGHTVRSEVS